MTAALQPIFILQSDNFYPHHCYDAKYLLSPVVIHIGIFTIYKNLSVMECVKIGKLYK